MNTIKVEKRTKLITISKDVFDHLNVTAKENKISLNKYLETIITDAARKDMLKKSSEIMLQGYKNDPDLTAFTELDGENYYETE
ncbi:MAG: hypothetical protein WCZ43_08030 [Proteiniphilum sp.]